MIRHLGKLFARPGGPVVAEVPPVPKLDDVPGRAPTPAAEQSAVVGGCALANDFKRHPLAGAVEEQNLLRPSLPRGPREASK